MKAIGDKVKLNGGVRGLHVQLRTRYRAGDAGAIVKIYGRTHYEVEIEGKGSIKVPALWVDAA